MTIAKVSPYEQHLIAASDMIIRLRVERRDVLMKINDARRVIAELHTLRAQLADCRPELTIRKVALLGMFAGGLLGYAVGYVSSVLL